MTNLTRAALVLVLLTSCHNLLANNGEIAYAYPIKSLTIDGNFDDWPENTPRYPLNRYEDDDKKNRFGDASAYFMTGYDQKTSTLHRRRDAGR